MTAWLKSRVVKGSLQLSASKVGGRKLFKGHRVLFHRESRDHCGATVFWTQGEKRAGIAGVPSSFQEGKHRDIGGPEGAAAIMKGW